MAEGRTRMCGSRLLSIFRRSRGSSPYYWQISKAFRLNIWAELYLCYKLALLELPTSQHHISVLIELRAAQLGLSCCFG